MNQTLDKISIIRRKIVAEAAADTTPKMEEKLEDMSFLTVQVQPSVVKNVYEPSIKIDQSMLDFDLRSELM